MVAASNSFSPPIAPARCEIPNSANSARKKKREITDIEMGEIPVYNIHCSNMLSKRNGDSNSSMVGGDVKRVYLNSRTRPYYPRKCKGARPTDIQSLPDELLSEILVRLPANHIHDVARLVCLRWYHIVHSPDFVNTQIQRSTYGLILSCHQVGADDRPVLVTATQGGQIETCEFSYRCRTGLYGSCNGLALDYNAIDRLLYILNPATKQELVLPSCSRHLTLLSHCGIAYAAASMEYKVTVPIKDKGDSSTVWSLAILTVGANESWRNVPDKHLSQHDKGFLSRFPLTTEGSIHWVIHGFRCVLTMDVETEIFTTSIVPLPEDYNPGSRFLSTGKFLSLLFPRGDLSWEVWGMRSRDGEWSKVLPDIELGAHKWRLQQLGYGEDKMLWLVGWVNYPEVLALGFSGKCRTCIFFNLKTHEINSTELPESYLHFAGFVHKNNMAWYG